MTTLPPAQAHSPTSVAAALAIRSDAQRLRDAVFAAIREAGADGLTDEEGILQTGIAASTYRPRRGELVAYTRVRDSGKTRRTHSGRQAVVWVAAEHFTAPAVVDVGAALAAKGVEFKKEPEPDGLSMAEWFASNATPKLPD